MATEASSSRPTRPQPTPSCRRGRELRGCVPGFRSSAFCVPSSGRSGHRLQPLLLGIDDVTISTNDVMNDLEVLQIVNGDVFNVWEYRVTPLEQAILGAEGG